MAIFEVTGVKTWNYSLDVDDALSAARWDVTYERIKTDSTWDPFLVTNLKVFHGEAAPDLVDLNVTLDGVSKLLVQGVVDRNGWTDREGGVVQGMLSGRDQMALALDKHPTLGFLVGPGTTLTTFGSVVNKIAGLAGLQVRFGVPGSSSGPGSAPNDYVIGRQFAVSIDQSWASVLANLLTPFRWSEKWRVDSWIENPTQAGQKALLVLAKRNYTNPERGTITVDASRLLVNRMEKSRLLTVADVLVLGATFTVVIQDPNGPTAGTSTVSRQVNITNNTPNTITLNCPGGGTTTIVPGGIIESYNETETTTTTLFSDNVIRPTSKTRTRTYLIRFGGGCGNTVRYETETWTWTYTQPGGPSTQFLSATQSHVLQVTDAFGGGTIATQNVINASTQWAYFPDSTGDVQTEEIVNIQLDEKAQIDPITGNLPISVDTHTKKTFIRMGNQLILETVVNRFDGFGNIIDTQEDRTLAPHPETAPGSGTSILKGSIQLQNQFFCGTLLRVGQSSPGFLRKEQSDLLGTNTDCCNIRTDLLDEHASTKVSASFSMAGDLRVQPGVVIVVQNAPVWWASAGLPTRFYVTSVQHRATSEYYDLDIEAVAWL
jgi:hypothetical protein